MNLTAETGTAGLRKAEKEERKHVRHLSLRVGVGLDITQLRYGISANLFNRNKTAEYSIDILKQTEREITVHAKISS